MAAHVDVVIVGAGLSGIGAACHLTRELPGLTYLVLDARARIGGTWDLFRYPGVRSDSDMFTMGYAFRPWTDDVTLADGPSIRDYVQATAEEYAVPDRIRFGHRVTGYAWDSATARWTVAFETAAGPGELTCDVLWSCTGYYDHDRPYDAGLPLAGFGGRVVHPQAWPDDLDLTGRRVAVVGSGATAMTLVPALVPPYGTAAHVTMVQRTPTYVLSLPGRDVVAARVAGLPYADAVNRWRNLLGQLAVLVAARSAPGLVRRLLRRGAARRLPAGYDVDRDFGPPYDPWDQRLCVVPDGDLFTAIGSGRADVVTGTIASAEPGGLRMADGRLVAADVVVTATGLRMLAFGGVEVTLDGVPLRLAEHVAYQGLMLDGVPNFVFTVGYAHASWTLRADLVSAYVVRLLRERSRRGARTVAPRPAGPMATRPILDLTSGYVRRAVDSFPKQGVRGPWRVSRTYLRDLVMLRLRPLRDSELEFR